MCAGSLYSRFDKIDGCHESDGYSTAQDGSEEVGGDGIGKVATGEELFFDDVVAVHQFASLPRHRLYPQAIS